MPIFFTGKRDRRSSITALSRVPANPRLQVRRCADGRHGDRVGSEEVFSAVYFTSSLDHSGAGGGLHVRTKDQDFTVARRLFCRTSYDPAFRECETKECYLAYVAAECKTNLDKTMFQEAVATRTMLRGLW